MSKPDGFQTLKSNSIAIDTRRASYNPRGKSLNIRRSPNTINDEVSNLTNSERI